MSKCKVIGHCVPCKNKGWLIIDDLCEDCQKYRTMKREAKLISHSARMKLLTDKYEEVCIYYI